MNTVDDSPSTKPGDMSQSREWAGRFFSRPTDLPISFVIDGNTIRGLPEDWEPERNHSLNPTLRSLGFYP